LYINVVSSTTSEAPLCNLAGLLTPVEDAGGVQPIAMLSLRPPQYRLIVLDILMFKMAPLEIACLGIRPIFKGCTDSLFQTFPRSPDSKDF
jgi:hypothetical protein